MRVSVALLSNVLFAASVLAAPSGLARAQEQTRRRDDTSPRFQSLILADVETEKTEAFLSSSTTTEIISQNWAGIIMTPPPTGTTFNDIGGTFVVPTPFPAAPGPGTWSGAAWVGIYNSDAIVQAGVIWSVTVSTTGVYSYSYSAVYEWLPAGSITYNIAIHAGDTISILCAIDSTSYASANCAVANQKTGAFVSETLTAPSSTTLDQGTTAAWIVEDYSTGSALVPFADFTTVTFTGPFVFAGGSSLNPTPTNTQVLNISQNSTLLTSVAFSSTNNVTVTWF
jgi:hypothetical protein